MSDIVTRLREATMSRLEMGWPAPHVVQRKEPLWLEAADEIERLRAELAAMREQRDEARENLRDACEEIATRVNSYSMLSTNKTAETIAVERGWDCYGQGGGA